MSQDERYLYFALSRLNVKSKKELYEKYLEAFIDSYTRLNNNFPLLEEKIRDKFIYDFEQVNEFTKEFIQSGTIFLTPERWTNVSQTEKSRIDMCFSVSEVGDFIIECKRLKTPDNNYLEQGIKRFVQLKYAHRETHAGMVGFVIAGDIDQIVGKLKNKVKDFHFSKGHEHLLDEQCVKWEQSFQSKHDRINETSIHLYHLFFDFITTKN